MLFSKIKKGRAGAWLFGRVNKMKSILSSQDGMGVVEVILIIVGNFTPYLGCVLCG